MTELPTISKTAYTSSTATADTFFLTPQATTAGTALPAALQRRLADGVQMAGFQLQPVKDLYSMRIVKVFIADTNENLPLDKRVLYSGDEKLTDLTDQELFFETDIKGLLDKHNELRATTRDRKQSEKFGRDVFLEPARIRDLKMTVVDVATF